ncbi:MAG: PaaI family thioesterase [Oscillospiraceae bacterium]|nr:PaaI family thioesterase [Oscillospiraceae bacterium]
MPEIMLSEIHNVPADKMGAIELLGIEKAIADDNGFCVVMEVCDIHMNTQGTVHGGILYTLCDQAVGSYIAYKKRKAVGMDGSIKYYRPAFSGDVLTASVQERKTGKTIGVYFVELKNQDNKLLADGIFTVMFMEQ